MNQLNLYSHKTEALDWADGFKFGFGRHYIGVRLPTMAKNVICMDLNQTALETKLSKLIAPGRPH